MCTTCTKQRSKEKKGAGWLPVADGGKKGELLLCSAENYDGNNKTYCDGFGLEAQFQRPARTHWYLSIQILTIGSFFAEQACGLTSSRCRIGKKNNFGISETIFLFYSFNL